MLIACLVVVVIFLIFIISTYFVTKKTYIFEIKGKTIKFSNAGSLCRIFIDNKLIQTHHMPQLIYGVDFKINIEEQEVILKCKSNSFGNKLSIRAFVEDNEVYNNGVNVKQKSSK